eukprot:EG_transcript_9103
MGLFPWKLSSLWASQPSAGASPLSPAADLVLTPLRPVGPPVRVGELWADQPLLALVTRRPGCPLCREEAAKLNEKKAQLEELGVRLVAIVKENLPDEVADFEHYWSSEILWDPDLGFFKAIGGGAVYKHSVVAFLLKLLSPFHPALRANVRRATAAGFTGNFVGEGLIAGGLYVLHPGGGLQYAFLEAELGDHAPLQEVVEVCQRLAAEQLWVPIDEDGEELPPVSVVAPDPQPTAFAPSKPRISLVAEAPACSQCHAGAMQGSFRH